MLTTIVNYTAHAPYTPTVWDTVALILLESVCALVLLLAVFWLPLSDWLTRRRIRKAEEYRWRPRQSQRRKFEPVGKSRWHGRN